MLTLYWGLIIMAFPIFLKDFFSSYEFKVAFIFLSHKLHIWLTVGAEKGVSYAIIMRTNIMYKRDHYTSEVHRK